MLVDMDSPLHTHLLKRRTTNRHQFISSDEEGGMACRPPEVRDREEETQQQKDTHCDSSPDNSANGGLSQQTEKGSETIITFTQKVDSPWDSDLSDSDTLTPDFKRG